MVMKAKKRVSRAHSDHLNAALLGLEKELVGSPRPASDIVRGSEVLRGSGSVDFHYSNHIARHCRKYLG